MQVVAGLERKTEAPPVQVVLVVAEMEKILIPQEILAQSILVVAVVVVDIPRQILQTAEPAAPAS
jgi:hypothetical protein